VSDVGAGALSRRNRARTYLLAAGLSGAAVVGVVVGADFESVSNELIPLSTWAAAAVLADALVVQVARSAALSMSLPVTLAAALVLSPPCAALVALLATWSRAERRRRDMAVVLFNRVQVALATLSAALVASALGSDPLSWPDVLIVSAAALAADAATNASMMLPYICLNEVIGPAGAARVLLGDRPAYNSLVYVSSALTGPVIALSYVAGGSVAMLASLAGIVLGGQALLESQRATHLTEAIQDKDAVIRSATDRIVSERRDERTTLAGELHDDVLPALFKVHLMGQVVKHDLSSGRLLELEEDVASLLDATEVAQSSIRGVVGGLRSSPLGPGGLAGAIRRVAEQLNALSSPPIDLELVEVGASDRAQLIALQVIREALTNAAKYSKAQTIRVTVAHEEGRLDVAVADDGCGFDPASDHEVHFGLVLMRERVEASGGTFLLDARLGQGVTVVASIPDRL
jgi:signal transduction histidine kinase